MILLKTGAICPCLLIIQLIIQSELFHRLEDFHPHKLRHSSASIAITSGADVVSVSERLGGHSDTAVTLRMYAHANQESIRRAGQIVRDAIKAQGA